MKRESKPKQSEIIQPAEDEVAVHAYHLWEEEGRPSGRDFDHWVKAKSHLIAAKTRETKQETVQDG